AAEAVELDVGLLRPVTRQQFHVLDRQEQLVTASVMHFQAIVRRAGGFDRAQSDEATDAVIDVNDEIAGGEAPRPRDKILGAARGTARADQTVAQNVLLADYCCVRGLEAAFQSEYGERYLRLGEPQCLRPRLDGTEIGKRVIGEHMTHAVTGAFAPQRDD